MQGEYASVYILDVPFHADAAYDYFIPAPLAGTVLAGMLVAVPYGRQNRRMTAAVVEVRCETALDEVKPIFGVVSDGVLLSDEAIRLGLFMKEHTLCTFGDAVRAMVPAAAISKVTDYYVPAEAAQETDGGAAPEQPRNDVAERLSEKALFLLSFIRSRGKVSLTRIRAEFGEDSGELLAALLREKCIVRLRESAEAGSNVRYTTYVSLAVPAEEAEAIIAGDSKVKLRSAAQIEVLKTLITNGRLRDGELFAMSRENATRVHLAALEKKGLVRLEKEPLYRNPYASSGMAQKENVLSEEQSAAYETLAALADSGEAKAALLHGVTGSGKTAVIRAMIDHVTASGRGVIVLVPEIALTPQTVGIFVGCYGDRVAVIHSGLSAGERFDAYRRIKDGLADVVIGTRSAVFAPVKRLGMIVIDEEQEHTYKSDTNPKYAAHDVARFRAAEHRALMLLASATPSLGSYYKAKTGVYTLVQLRERYGGAKLPEVRVSDMREEIRAGNLSPIGEGLAGMLRETVGGGRQAIVFLNRRGYNSFITCRACGENVRCPNCSVSLTYHTRRAIEDGDEEGYLRRRMASGILACHYCGYRTRVPETCPSCGSDHFAFMGYGTQRVEEELNGLLPGKRVVRMDMDTTGGKFAHEAILSGFRSGETDVLVGTQMVTKGHDFPKVTLVGVLNADSSLYLDDFRASERTFAMLTQVVGRAGRGSEPGVAVVQTMNPDSDVIALAAKQDYEAFYEREIRIRRALTFPPMCDIAVVTLSSADETLVNQSAVRLSSWLREAVATRYADVKTVIFGPFEAPVYKVQNKCRMRLVVKCKLNRQSRALFAELLTEFGRSGGKRLTVSVDFNPSSV